MAAAACRLEASTPHATSTWVTTTHLYAALAALTAGLTLTHCAHGGPQAVATSAAGNSAQAVSAAAGATGVEAEAQALYDAGTRALQRGLYTEAVKHLEAVRTEYPYSRFAALAELRIADSHMRRSQYLEAIDAYRNFLRYHPTHSDAAYALGRVGEAFYAQIPGDWWFMPPAAERDLTHVRQAIDSYRDLLARYPDAANSAAAQKNLDACRAKLAEHEMYVARYYAGRQQWAGALARAQELMRDYPGLGFDADALYVIAQAQQGLGQLAAAIEAAEKLLAEFPDTTMGRRVPGLLATLRGIKS